MSPFDVLENLKHRTADAIIAQSGIAHEGLRRKLREMLAGSDPSAGSLLQQPVIEGAHPFITADVDIDALTRSIIHPTFVNAIDELPKEHEYRFPRSRKPFKHQLEAWQLLSGTDPKSVVVTSGTGSGKTECFLFPILSDLAAQAQGSRDPIEGVQAIMLYPLNALIESQQERLSAWTRPFRGTIRYGLYNGDMERTSSASDRRASPEQVIDRETLRASPPPMLVTNVTMLEYMLVRAEDQPILNASRGKLKWIVLDEAHSFVGAAAAEIALLLRRTMLAFGVKPDEMRFVATSATIGSGPDTLRQLQKFLADVAGVSEDRVYVVEGRRQIPTRPAPQPLPADLDLPTKSPDRLYDILGGHAPSWELVEKMFSQGVPLAGFSAAAQTLNVSAIRLVEALSRASRTQQDGTEERLAPMRLHAFERAVPGLWSCINPTCDHNIADWPFGALLPDRADRCPHCAAPVLEVVSCTECGEVYLDGVENNGRLSAPLRNPPRDEFAFDRVHDSDLRGDDEEDVENPAEPDDGGLALALEHLFAVNATTHARQFWVEPHADGWRVIDGAGTNTLALRSERKDGACACPHCKPVKGDKEILRPVRFGAPFILGNAAPILLEAVTPSNRPGEKLPSFGRRLLSFTDSRQGTARMAAKLQTESERSFIRSFIYHQVQASMGATGDLEKVEASRAAVKGLELAIAASPSPQLDDLLRKERKRLDDLTQGSRDGIAWRELVNRLAGRHEVHEWILPLWQPRGDGEVFTDEFKLAEFLLLREFDRRPKRATSMESFGLAKLINPAIAALTEASLPKPFKARGKTLDDWKGYLDTVLTHFVRNNRFTTIDRTLLHWISHKAVRRSLVGPDRNTDGDTMLRAWPNGHFRASPRSRPVALLLAGLGLNLSNNSDRDELDECLHEAWRQVQTCFSDDPERRIYDFARTRVAPVADAFWCPVTRRVLDCAPFGLTPYGLTETSEKRKLAMPLTMPRHPGPILGQVDFAQARAETQIWLEGDEVTALRTKGAWTNISDRVALFSDYARSAEHSAQQESRRLRQYEQQFKAGKINILNCSTTMEMGVDIGSVSSVMMTNVPPSIANYRQRVGRAGRRGQSLAMAFTFCKDRPLDRDAFVDPSAFLQRAMAAPKVTLSSRPIVQRHVNAYLLGQFMRERAGDPLKMQLGAFVGCPDDPKQPRLPKDERPISAFIEWLKQPSTTHAHQAAIASLTARSVLAGDHGLIETTAQAAGSLEKSFLDEWTGLVTLTRDDNLRDAAKSRMAIELRRLCGEFLVSGLADRGFLPGHGFPTDVVTFIPGKEFKLASEAPQDGSRQSRALGPQRSLDIAIRDYAPGSEVVLDGLVHRSAGVTLNWKRPATEENLADIQSLKQHWRCRDCGESDVSRPPEQCPACGSSPLKVVDFLRPAGFSVDPREKAHSETDTLQFVSAEDPAVSVRDAAWQSLPLPELGRYRSSREGLVFYHNNGGQGRDGFDICLECGRAELHDGQSAHGVLKDHKPLRHRKDVDICPGNDRPFSIQHLALGLEITTDVFELQLPRQVKRATAHALVIALRESLAGELGIDADEMGFAVSQGRTSLGGPAISLLIFDKASGGAGFAVSMADLLRPVLDRADRILDCRTPGCQRGCAACVLTSDAPEGHDDLDRLAALAYLREHLTLPADLSIEDRFEASAHLSIDPVDEMDNAVKSRPGAAMTLFLAPDQKAEGIADWSIAQGQLRSWSNAGHPARLLVQAAWLAELSPAEKLALRDFALRNDVTLLTGAAPIFANGATAFSAIGTATQLELVWATRDKQSIIAGSDWGQPHTLPVAHADVSLELAAVPVLYDALLPKAGACYMAVTKQLDGTLDGFGARAAQLIGKLMADCGITLAGRTIKATYRDPFVSSPLVARLMLDTVARLADASQKKPAALVIETRQPRANTGRPSWQMFHDWPDAGDQRETIETLGQLRGLHTSLRHSNVPHGRYLQLDMDEMDRVTIVLDQGFGAWSYNRQIPAKHDFEAVPADQAKAISTKNVMLASRGVGGSYIVVSRG
tara:strand:- start:6668 stop:12763 length:6096 start_codon:yes stop_codon:yes gene_type:complete